MLLKIEKQAADKTPKVQRTGNYYTQTQNHVSGSRSGEGNTYNKLEPIHKVTKRLMKQQNNKSKGLFNPLSLLSYLFKDKTA